MNRDCENHVDAEARWDAKAEHYNASQNWQGIDDAKRVAEMLHETKGLLAGEILDVGGGTGLYAIPFAAYAKSVTVADLSAKMLAYAKENAENKGLYNLEYVKLDWDKADLKRLGWEHRFDLVFASMCPAVNSSEGLAKMTAASKKWCCVSRYIQMENSVSERLKKALNLPTHKDSHSNRHIVQNFFNDLWEKGFDPEIRYFEETTENVYSLDEAVQYYGERYYEAAKERNLNLRQILAEMAEDGRLQETRYKKLALILWQV